MSTQPNLLPESAVAKLPNIEDQEEPKSVLDEPWRVTMLPDDEVPTIAVPSPDAEPRRKSLPWKRGDVARLKDDSPEGMMRYIATHTSGWWQEMAERALRDTEKAERMAEQAGWQPGQYWSLEVDAETREKMRAQEEARRQREEQERAREQAEKEGFARRQMELLKKAGRAPRCEYLYTDGRGCRAPQVRGERWCHGHAKMMSYRPEHLELLPMEDEQAVTVNLYRVTKSLLSGRITEKVAGLALWSVAIAAPGARKIARDRRDPAPASQNQASTPQGEKRALRGPRARVIARDRRDRKAKIHHGGAETRRKASHESKRKSKTHSGVPKCKSFRSGVGRGRGGGLPKSPNIAENENLHSSASPRLRVERNDQNTGRSDHRDTGRSQQTSHSSVSPCLRGEQNAAARQNCVFPPGGIIL